MSKIVSAWRRTQPRALLTAAAAMVLLFSAGEVRADPSHGSRAGAAVGTTADSNEYRAAGLRNQCLDPGVGPCVITPGRKAYFNIYAWCSAPQTITWSVLSAPPEVTAYIKPLTQDLPGGPFTEENTRWSKLFAELADAAPLGQYDITFKITSGGPCNFNSTFTWPVFAAKALANTGAETLYSFTCGADGCHPYAGVISDGTNLFGTNVGGGTGVCPPKDAVFGCGVIYQLSPSAGPGARAPMVEKTLHDFSGGADGGKPIGGLLKLGKRFYGTTYYGGNSGNGVIYQLTQTANPNNPWRYDVIYHFCPNQGCSDGAHPQGELITDGKSLFGTTTGGGAGTGVVFSLTRPADSQSDWTYQVLKTFPLDAQGGISGAIPTTGLVMAGKKLYGTTSAGGEFGQGEIFSLSPPAAAGARTAEWTERVLYSFTGGADGGRPQSALLRDGVGNLYGTTQFGGTGPCSLNGNGCGVVYRLSPPAASSSRAKWAYSVLHDFTGVRDGARPVAGVVMDDAGDLYGTATFGGAPTPVPGVGFGVVFRLSEPPDQTTPWNQTILHKFTGRVDGAFPYLGFLWLDGGTIYGTTYGGGSSPWSGGVVYRIP